MPAFGQSPSILIPEFSIQNQIAVGHFPVFTPILNSKFSIQNYPGEGYFHSGTPEPLSYTPIRWMRKSKVL